MSVTGVRGQFSVSIRSFITGLHHLRVLVDGVDIYGSPFPVHVAEWKMSNLVTFAKGLNRPTGVAVTDDGQHVVVAEWHGHCVTVFSSSGEVVRRFGRHGIGPGLFYNPFGVAVSADKHIFVANCGGKLHKLSFSSYETSANVRGCGAVAIHPSGKIFTTDDEQTFQVFSDNITPSYSFSSRNVNIGRITDIAIDTKGTVYVIDPNEGNVLKFTPEGKHLATIGSKGEKPHQFACPIGICIDSNDIMYITDSDKHKVMVFTTEGEFLGCTSVAPQHCAVTPSDYTHKQTHSPMSEEQPFIALNDGPSFVADYDRLRSNS